MVFRGAANPKLAKVIVSQNRSPTRNGTGTDVSVRQMMNKPATPTSKGLRFGSFVQIRDIFEEEFENMLAGKQDAKAALDNSVKRGNEMLRRFEKTAKDAG